MRNQQKTLIKRLRKELSLTQTEFAQEIGVSLDTVKSWEESGLNKSERIKVDDFIFANRQKLWSKNTLENYPAADEVLGLAFKANPWDYKSQEDFIQYGISEDLGIALNRELEQMNPEDSEYFWKNLNDFGY